MSTWTVARGRQVEQVAVMARLVALLAAVANAQVPLSLDAYLARSVDNQNSSQLIIKRYLTEFLAPLRDPISDGPVVLLLDNSSFLLECGCLDNFKEEVTLLDMKTHSDTEDGNDVVELLHRHELILDELGSYSLSEHPTVSKERLLIMLNNVFTLPRNFRHSDHFRTMVGNYISNKFGSLGLVTGLQSFTPSQFHDMYYDSGENLPQGTNIFGILPGSRWGTPEDRILVLGAHWDTVDTTDGYNDNGSGVAALLEVARVLAKHKCKLQNSIVFVAFDLEEVGCQGSLEFVHRFLLPQLLKRFGQKEWSGAIVADTLLAFNDSVGSQHLPDSVRTLLPALAEDLKEDGFRGNYLNVVSRRGVDETLRTTFQKHWSDLHRERPEFGQFRLRESQLGLRALVETREELENMTHYLRSDHSRFWLANDTSYRSLSAILITDTGPDRGEMRECYHSNCDSVRKGHRARFANYDFYEHTVQALLDTALDVAEAHCSPPDKQFKRVPFQPIESNASGRPVRFSPVIALLWLIVPSFRFAISRL